MDRLAQMEREVLQFQILENAVILLAACSVIWIGWIFWPTIKWVKS